MKKLTIGILGLGAIGSVLSFTLNEKHDTYYYNRSARTELTVLINSQLQRKAISLSSLEEGLQLDWLLICLKEYHYKIAQKELHQLIQPRTKVAVIRNGVDLKKQLLSFTDETNILECMIDCPTQLTDDGYFHQLRKPKITVKKNTLSSAFRPLFLSEKIIINQVEDFITENWKKLIESSALGGILSLSGESCWIFKDQELVALFEKIVKEGIDVARAEGAQIEYSFKKELVKKLMAYPESKESSMLIDRKGGKPIEINAKNGIISSFGKKHKIKTEINDLICLLLKYTNRKESN